MAKLSRKEIREAREMAYRKMDEKDAQVIFAAAEKLTERTGMHTRTCIGVLAAIGEYLVGGRK